MALDYKYEVKRHHFFFFFFFVFASIGIILCVTDTINEVIHVAHVNFALIVNDLCFPQGR